MHAYIYIFFLFWRTNNGGLSRNVFIQCSESDQQFMEEIQDNVNYSHHKKGWRIVLNANAIQQYLNLIAKMKLTENSFRQRFDD